MAHLRDVASPRPLASDVASLAFGLRKRNARGPASVDLFRIVTLRVEFVTWQGYEWKG